MKRIIINSYSDLKNIKDEVIVDLSKLGNKMSIRALDFLCGLTFKNGSLKKIKSREYLVKIN